MTSPKKPGDAAPPSLFGASKPGLKVPDTTGDGMRMLSGLDARPADKRAGDGVSPLRKRLAPLAFPLAVLLAGGAAAAWRYADNAVSQWFSAPASAKPAVTEPTRAEARAPAAAASGGTLAAAPSAASAPATIESMIAPAGIAALAASDLADRKPERSSPFASLAASEPMPTPASGVAGTAASRRGEPKRATGHLAQASEPAMKTAAKTAVKSGTAPAKLAAHSAAGASASADSDVDLLAAIVKHLDRTKPATRKETQPPSLAQLVEKCKKLGGSRAEASCRRQICEGNHGKSPACPFAPAPPRALPGRAMSVT